MWYAIADAQELGFAIEPHEARDLSLVGERIRVAAREQLPCVHPENPAIAGVSIVQLAEPWQGAGQVSRNAVVVAPGGSTARQTGTGLSGPARRPARARLDGRRRRDDARVRDRLDLRRPHRRKARVGDRPAIVPAIRGSAWITGVTQLYVDPDDPFPEGYLLSDTWGVSGLDSQSLSPVSASCAACVRADASPEPTSRGSSSRPRPKPSGRPAGRPAPRPRPRARR